MVFIYLSLKACSRLEKSQRHSHLQLFRGGKLSLETNNEV